MRPEEINSLFRPLEEWYEPKLTKVLLLKGILTGAGNAQHILSFRNPDGDHHDPPDYQLTEESFGDFSSTRSDKDPVKRSKSRQTLIAVTQEAPDAAISK